MCFRKFFSILFIFNISSCKVCHMYDRYIIMAFVKTFPCSSLYQRCIVVSPTKRTNKNKVVPFRFDIPHIFPIFFFGKSPHLHARPTIYPPQFKPIQFITNHHLSIIKSFFIPPNAFHLFLFRPNSSPFLHAFIHSLFVRFSIPFINQYLCLFSLKFRKHGFTFTNLNLNLNLNLNYPLFSATLLIRSVCCDQSRVVYSTKPTNPLFLTSALIPIIVCIPVYIRTI